MTQKLMTRDAFRETVFNRDGFKCVFCGEPAKDAHHIIERRLWADGGYYVDNGASVCELHHIKCETTELSVEEVREACGITKKILPMHLYDDVIYDKWGNIILDNGSRLRGELFYDESVQKILAKGPYFNDFVKYVKYPRTYHLPWSKNITDDDRVIPSLSSFEGREIVVTVKMDGENTTMYNDYIHARSLDSKNHDSRNWVKNYWGTICGDIPEGWRICGENLFAEHSIHYDELESYFYGFSIWNERNECISWDDTLEWFKLLEIVPVPVLYRGPWDQKVIEKLEKTMDFKREEGYVVRVTDMFNFRDFRNSVAKYVRKDHVLSVKHWLHGRAIIPNTIKKV